MFRHLIALVLILIGSAAAVAVAAQPPSPDQTVEILPINGTIDDGTEERVQRGVLEARERGASAIVLEVDSAGGLPSSATAIVAVLRASSLPVDTYVSGRAWSVAARIASAGNRLVLAPQASVGTVGDIKLAPTFAQMHSEVQVEPTLDAALVQLGYAHARTVTAPVTFGERLEQFVTNPEFSGMLLAAGFLGLLIEMQTLSGIAGTIGIVALTLFFGSHAAAGVAGAWAIPLAFIGVLGIAIEFHVLPGHGIAGIGGLCALVAAIVMSFGSDFTVIAVQALALAIVLTTILFIAAKRVFPENAFLRRLAFVDVQGAEYIANADLSDLIGETGVAVTLLRPAGVATIDGERVDVLTDGEFVSAGTRVRVVRVEGARVFVHSLERRGVSEGA